MASREGQERGRIPRRRSREGSKKLIAVLLYVIELGPVEQQIVKQAVRSGQPIPDRIRNAPELIIGLALYLSAFFELDSDRTHHLGLTPIPRRSIAEYARDNELDDEQTDDLFYFIRRMDTAHLDRVSEKTPKAKGGMIKRMFG